MSRSSRPELFGIHHRWIVAALLGLFALAGAVSLRNDSATFDETAHLPAGYTYLDLRDFRLNPEHPPLSKLWAALPVWLDPSNDADYGSRAWAGRGIVPGATLRTGASQWLFGFEFINGPIDSRERRDPARVLVPARLAMLVWGMLLGLIVYAWALEMWGSNGALLAFFLYCLSPTMLAHSRLVTTDLPIALGFTATLWLFWRFTRQPDRVRGTLVGLALGFSLLVKFSALLLLPLLFLLGVLWVYLPRLEPWERGRHWRAWLFLMIAVLLIAYALLWAGYGFRYLATIDPEYQLDWEVVGLSEGPTASVVRTALEWRVLPQAYLYGLAYFAGGAEQRLAFLNGEESVVGWWYYFPEAFLIKTSPALLVLLVLLLAFGVRRRRLRSFDGWFLALPVLVYCGISIAGNLNIGHRHLVAVYPFLFVACGGLVWFWREQPDEAPLQDDEQGAPPRPRARPVLLAVLVVWYVASFVAATPGYLSYFNLLAGGSKGGWRYLLDSNIDWGQDLLRLKQVMDRRGIDRVHLAYFGTADPKAYGIRFRKVRLVHDFYPGEPEVRPASGDTLAVSVNLLQGLYLDKDGAFADRALRRGWIDRVPIEEWLAEGKRLAGQGERQPVLAEWLVARGRLTGAQRSEIEAGMLSTYLAGIRDTLEPFDRAGDSILLYRIP